MLNTNIYPEIFSFFTAGAKNKDKIISLNEVVRINHFQLPKIKNLFKENLKVWNIPDNVGKKYEKLFIEFHIFRHNKRVLDSDNLGAQVKWIIDAIKDKGWLEKDDNQITYIVYPAILDRNKKDTTLQVIVRDNNG